MIEYPLVGIKDFNVLINGESFLTPLEKVKKKHTKRLLKWEEIMTPQQVIY